MKLLKTLKLALTPRRYEYNAENLHPNARKFLELFDAGDISAAEQLYYVETPIERIYLLEAISDMVAQDDFYDNWFNQSNGPPLSCLVRGALLTKRASILDDPDLGQDAASYLIRVLMGLNAEWAQIDEVLAIMRSRPEPHLMGELNYLIASCEKWLGSHEKMYQSAHNAIEAYPEHPEIGALQAVAHWERLLYYDFFNNDEAGSLAYRQNSCFCGRKIIYRDRPLSRIIYLRVFFANLMKQT